MTAGVVADDLLSDDKIPLFVVPVRFLNRGNDAAGAVVLVESSWLPAPEPPRGDPVRRGESYLASERIAAPEPFTSA